MPLGVLEARMWSVSVIVVGVGVPLRARIVLDMVHLDGRVGCGAPESCARYLRCYCEHLLGAKGSHDASVRVQARVLYRALLRLYMRGHATPDPCNARDGEF